MDDAAAWEQARWRYRPLVHLLLAARPACVALTFQQLESSVGRLPRGARAAVTWWSNVARPGSRYRHVHGWLDAGYHVERVDLRAETVTFRYDLAAAGGDARPPARVARPRRLYLDLPGATYAALAEAARRHNLPTNALVRQILDAWLAALDVTGDDDRPVTAIADTPMPPMVSGIGAPSECVPSIRHDETSNKNVE
ncbi:MAG: DUF7662 domain-containing protein [Thermomicrobiales bacterium]